MGTRTQVDESAHIGGFQPVGPWSNSIRNLLEMQVLKLTLDLLVQKLCRQGQHPPL